MYVCSSPMKNRRICINQITAGNSCAWNNNQTMMFTWTMTATEQQFVFRKAFNSLVPGIFEYWLRWTFSSRIWILIDQIALLELPLIECHGQCWTRSLSPYAVTGPRWVNCAYFTPWRRINCANTLTIFPPQFEFNENCSFFLYKFK